MQDEVRLRTGAREQLTAAASAKTGEGLDEFVACLEVTYGRCEGRVVIACYTTYRTALFHEDRVVVKLSFFFFIFLLFFTRNAALVG